MPRANWGVSSRDMDSFDREAQYKPYAGPIPPNGVYQWTVKKLQHVAAIREKNPQLRIGLELKPRNRDERKFAGYFIMEFAPVTDKTLFRYVPFLDAVGVSSRDFERNTITDEEGNISKIGRWRNTGSELILGELRDDTDQNGAPRKKIGWMGSLEAELPDDEVDDDDEYDDDEEGSDEDYDDEEDDDF
jgi:hypothetical protein